MPLGRSGERYMLRFTSRALSWTFSPPRSRSLPAPSIVLHPASVAKNAAAIIAIKAFIVIPFGLLCVNVFAIASAVPPCAAAIDTAEVAAG